MATGNYNEMKLVFERKQGDKNAEVGQPNIKVYKSGPFFECYVNDVMVGKVMKVSDCLVSQAMTTETKEMSECSGRCIKLKNHIIILSMSEYLDVAWERVQDTELRAEAQEAKSKGSMI